MNIELCGLKALTGLDCPGCGLLHGLFSLFKGDIRGAIEYNPLSLLVPVWLIYLVAAKRVCLSKGVRSFASKMVLMALFLTWGTKMLFSIAR